MENKSFRPDFGNPHQNAVVGGGWDGDPAHAYREGFMQATLALLAAAAEGSYIEPKTGESSFVYVDALVYPICFNARHFIELFLKDSIRGVNALGTNAAQRGVFATHNLNDLWDDFERVIQRDSRLVDLGMPLSEVFKDIAQRDNTSMTFRYSHDLGEHAHLADIELINLDVLGDRLRQMFKQAEEFSLCLEMLQHEYAQGTFTRKLHRANLQSIAELLPAHNKWAQELKPIKNQICEQFGLSSNDFCKALVLIKNHREFSGLVGLELPLAGLPVNIFTRLASVHAGEAAHSVITKEEWLNLDAVMEIGRLGEYSEAFDPYLKYISSPSYDGPFDPAHLTRNAFASNQRLYSGLMKLNQKKLLAALAEAIPNLAEPVKTPPKLRTEEIAADVKDLLKNSMAFKYPAYKAAKGDELGDE